MVETRETFFLDAFDDAVEYLKERWPSELGPVRFMAVRMPPSELAERAPELPRYLLAPTQQAILVVRFPVERLTRLHIKDAWHKRAAIENAVYRAAADYLGRDPWEVAPDRWRHH